MIEWFNFSKKLLRRLSLVACNRSGFMWCTQTCTCTNMRTLHMTPSRCSNMYKLYNTMRRWPPPTRFDCDRQCDSVCVYVFFGFTPMFWDVQLKSALIIRIICVLVSHLVQNEKKTTHKKTVTRKCNRRYFGERCSTDGNWCDIDVVWWHIGLWGNVLLPFWCDHLRELPECMLCVKTSAI